MPKAAKEKAKKVTIPELPWSENSHWLIWQLITELEKLENYKVLFGKKKPGENTSGDTRTLVFQRIAEAILPDLWAQDAKTVGVRLKGQLERLTRTYRKHAARLQQTGDGVENSQKDENGNETLRFYIPGEGPNDTTPPEALNIWQEIESKFKFFPRLHRIYASRPNVTPIAVTTALGPEGRKTVWYQSPDEEDAASNSNIDPELLAQSYAAGTQHVHAALLSQSLPPTPAPPSRTFGTDVTAGAIINTLAAPPIAPVGTPNTPTAGGSTKSKENTSGSKPRRAKPSTVSREAIEKARMNIQKQPVKRTLLDTMLDIQAKNQTRWDSETLEKAKDKKLDRLLKERELGIWTIKEYKERVLVLEQVDAVAKPLPICLSPSPPTSPVSHQGSLEYQGSPDWDMDNFYAED